MTQFYDFETHKIEAHKAQPAVVSYLEGLGYDPKNISQYGLSKLGFYQFERDESGGRLYDKDSGTLVTRLTPWKTATDWPILMMLFGESFTPVEEVAP